MRKYRLLALLLLAAGKLAVLAGAGVFSVDALRAFAYRWDGGHFILIAREGYKHDYSYAFAPLYPATIRVLAWAGLPYWAAALLAANLASLALLHGLARLYGWRAAGLSMLYPPLPLYATAAYSEPLALALLAHGLAEARRGRSLLAGILLGLASLTRYTMALAGGIVFLVLAARRRRREALLLAVGLAPAWAGLALFFSASPWGLLVYFRVEKYWLAGLATPLDQARWILEHPIAQQFSVLRGVPTPPVVYLVRNVLFALLALAGLALAWKRWRDPLSTWASVPGLALPLLTVGVPALSVPRLLLASIASLAGATPRSGPGAAAWILGGLAAACVAGAWHVDSFFG